MFDLIAFLKIVGLTGVGATVFAESGLLVGFFLPGDSLLFTAGFLASQGVFPILALILVAFVGAVIGDSVGYAFGYRVGPKIFTRDDSLVFHKDHLLRAQAFYEKHGRKTIIMARFLPIVRTFAPILAGVGKMHYSTFVGYNIIGGAAWAMGIPLIGYFLGNQVEDIDRYLLPIIIGIIFLSFLPTIIHFIRHADDRRRLFATVRHIIEKNIQKQ